MSPVCPSTHPACNLPKAAFACHRCCFSRWGESSGRATLFPACRTGFLLPGLLPLSTESTPATGHTAVTRIDQARQAVLSDMQSQT